MSFRLRSLFLVGLGLTALPLACGSDDSSGGSGGSSTGGSSTGGSSGSGGTGGSTGGTGGSTGGTGGATGGSSGTGATGGSAGSGGAGATGGAAGSDAGTDADDGSTDAGSDASDAGDGGFQACDRFVNATSGVDTNAGTQTAPYKTVLKASQNVGAGCTIWLFDGTHTITQATMPANVSLRALNPGAATLDRPGGASPGIIFPAGGAIDGVKSAVAGALGGIAVQGGTVTITNTQFQGAVNNGYAFLTVEQTGKVVLNAPTVSTSWCSGTCTGVVAHVNDTAELEVNGGLFSGWLNTYALFSSNKGGKLTLKNVTIKDNPAKPVAIALGNSGINLNTSTLKISGSVISASGTTNVIDIGWGTPVVEISDTTIEKGGSALYFDGANYAGVGDQKVTLTNVKIDQNQRGVQCAVGGSARPMLMLTNSSITASVSSGVNIVYAAYSSFSMTGGSLSNNGEEGFTSQNSPTAVNALKLRGVTISGNQRNGVFVAGGAGSTADLGASTGDPGNNTITDNAKAGSSYSGLRTAMPATVTTNAIGNTWIANSQGADAAGKYANGTQATGPVTTGANYRIVTSGAVLKL